MEQKEVNRTNQGIQPIEATQRKETRVSSDFECRKNNGHEPQEAKQYSIPRIDI
jgi:hypothetical protein